MAAERRELQRSAARRFPRRACARAHTRVRRARNACLECERVSQARAPRERSHRDCIRSRLRRRSAGPSDPARATAATHTETHADPTLSTSLPSAGRFRAHGALRDDDRSFRPSRQRPHAHGRILHQHEASLADRARKPQCTDPLVPTEHTTARRPATPSPTPTTRLGMDVRTRRLRLHPILHLLPHPAIYSQRLPSNVVV